MRGPRRATATAVKTNSGDSGIAELASCTGSGSDVCGPLRDGADARRLSLLETESLDEDSRELLQRRLARFGEVTFLLSASFSPFGVFVRAKLGFAAEHGRFVGRARRREALARAGQARVLAVWLGTRMERRSVTTLHAIDALISLSPTAWVLPYPAGRFLRCRSSVRHRNRAARARERVSVSPKVAIAISPEPHERCRAAPKGESRPRSPRSWGRLGVRFAWIGSSSDR